MVQSRQYHPIHDRVRVLSNDPVQVNEAKNVVYNNITIDTFTTNANAAHNTDGWDIYRSDNIVIKNSVINNGDDCVSLKPSRFTPSHPTILPS